MAKGRPPKPTERRRREGGTAKRGAVSHRKVPEPVVVGGLPDRLPVPPDDLPDVGKPVWTELCRLLLEAGMLDLVDLAALRLMVVQYVAARDFETPVDESLTASLEQQAAFLTAKKRAVARKLANRDEAGNPKPVEDVAAAELDGIAKLETRLTNLREYQRLRAEGFPVALGSTGQVVEHPLAQARRAAAALFLRFASEFGGTPLGRARIALGNAQTDTLTAELERELGRGRRSA